MLSIFINLKVKIFEILSFSRHLRRNKPLIKVSVITFHKLKISVQLREMNLKTRIEGSQA